ncbi:MAG: carboxypeptidase-like regulatory domain-containing protein, partial [Bacteroidota bacterium]
MSTPSFLTAFVLALLMVPASLAQTGTLAGRVTDAEANQPLPGATVQLIGTERGAATDAFGRFVLRSVPSGTATVRVSFVGFESQTLEAQVSAGETTTLDVTLAPDPDQIGEVVIRSEKFVRNLQDTQTSVGVLTDVEIKAIPIRDWEDATGLIGNVSTSGNGTFTIRGIPNTGVGGGSGPTAALYVDGVQQGRFGTFRTIRGA